MSTQPDMSQVILSINAGSSSLKCSLYSADASQQKLEKLAGAEVSAIGTERARLKYTRGSSKQESDLEGVKEHREAFEHVLDAFIGDSEVGVGAKEDITYACHRVVRTSWPPITVSLFMAG